MHMFIGCNVGDILYQYGETVPGSGPCEKCLCDRNGVSCSPVQCQVKAGCKALHRADHCCPLYQCGKYKYISHALLLNLIIILILHTIYVLNFNMNKYNFQNVNVTAQYIQMVKSLSILIHAKCVIAKEEKLFATK